jgi:ATP-dependent RNA helicase DeaD
MRSERTPTIDEITHLFSAAGYRSLNPLQERLIPHLLKGRDVALPAGRGSGKTAGYLVPYMAAFRGVREGVRVLILVAEPEKLRKISREHLRFSRVMRDAPPLLVIGDTEDARREGRRLEGAPVILAGTSERVIDHIRRGSLSWDALSAVVIEQPEGELAPGFIRDVEFIFAKLPARRQVVLFNGGAVEAPVAPGAAVAGAPVPQGITGFLHHPVVLDGGSETPAPAAAGESAVAWVEPGSVPKEELLGRLILARGTYPVVVLHSARASGDRLARTLGSLPGRIGVLPLGMPVAARRRLITSFEGRELDVLFAPLPIPADLDPSLASLLIYFDVPLPRPAGGPALAAAARRQDPLRSGRRVLLIVDAAQARDFQKLQEALPMMPRKEEHPADGDVIRGSIDRILRKVKDEEDPKELDRVRALFRRQVPLFMRSYVAAYLLKSQLPRLGPAPLAPAPAPAERPRQRGGERGRSPRETVPPRSERPAGAGRPPAGESSRGSGRQQQPPQPQHSQPVPAEARGGFTQLFVSIGRNRRVYPRDLTALFTDTLKLRAEEIGSVRVFDKYSFVEIATPRAEEAIAQLSGKDFKGRPVSVNFAKKREDKEGL